MPARSSLWEWNLSTATVIAKQSKKALLGSHGEQASYETLSAEVVRVSLWVQSAYRQTSSLHEAAVPTRRVLDEARAWWWPIQEAHREDMKQQSNDQSQGEEDMELTRDVLDDLAEQGDVYTSGKGYWLPAPLRLVPLAQGRYLLTGGMPTQLLAEETRHTLHLHGSFRHLHTDRLSPLLAGAERTVSNRFQSLENWLGPSPPSLDDVVHIFETRTLHPVAYHSNSTLDAYCANINTTQYRRWRSLDTVDDGRYLLRTSKPWGIKQYSIGSIRNHRLVEESAELHDMDIRRLCYALDRRAGKPTRARWNPGQGELTLYSELPGRERKYLSAIGFLQENEDGYYPRRWANIGSAYISDVETLLNGLGIQIQRL